MDIFKLVGSVFVETDKANESLSKTGDQAEKTGSKLGGITKTAGKVALGIGAAAGAAGAAILGMATKTAEAADEIDKGSKRMGISTDEYQKLKYAAGQCGVEMSTLEKAAKKLEGTDINMDDAMQSIMELGTAEERSAKAAELFGDSIAYQMAPLLEESGESFEDLKQRAEDLGIVMSEDAVAAGVKMGDTLSDVKQAFGGVTNALGAELMPIVQQVLDWVLAHMPEIQSVISGVVGFIRGAIQSIAPIIQNLMPVVEALFSGIVALWESVLQPALNAITSFLGNVFAGNFKAAFSGIVNAVKQIFSGMVNAVKSPLNSVIRVINKFIGNLNKLKVPDWVPEVGGKGINISTIPLLAKGGDIVKGGAAIVGEAGAELIDLPAGARVTPLKGDSGITSIDYEKMASAMVTALMAVAPQLKSEIAPDEDGFFKIMRQKNSQFKKVTGKGAFA